MTSLCRPNVCLAQMGLFLLGAVGFALPLTAASSSPLDTAVPSLTPNSKLHAETWNLSLPVAAREPFSYARQIRQLPPAPIIPIPTTPTESLSDRYATEESLFSKALENRAQKRLDEARDNLKLCLARLEVTLDLAKTRLLTATPDSREQAESAFFQTNALRLQTAARLELNKVELHARFEKLVLRSPEFKINAIQAAAASAADPTAAVLFAGYRMPFKVGDRIALKSTAGESGPAELKILALTQASITVLFDHQGTFEIPVLHQSPVGDNSPAGKD